MILSAAPLLRWRADRHAGPDAAAAAQRIDREVVEAISAGSRTPDLGGTDSTSGFTAAVVELLGERP